MFFNLKSVINVAYIFTVLLVNVTPRYLETYVKCVLILQLQINTKFLNFPIVLLLIVISPLFRNIFLLCCRIVQICYQDYNHQAYHKCVNNSFYIGTFKMVMFQCINYIKDVQGSIKKCTNTTTHFMARSSIKKCTSTTIILNVTVPFPSQHRNVLT